MEYLSESDDEIIEKHQRKSNADYLEGEDCLICKLSYVRYIIKNILFLVWFYYFRHTSNQA